MRKNFAFHGFFARLHAVDVATDGVNLAIVQKHAVRMSALPTGVCVS